MHRVVSDIFLILFLDKILRQFRVDQQYNQYACICGLKWCSSGKLPDCPSLSYNYFWFDIKYQIIHWLVEVRRSGLNPRSPRTRLRQSVISVFGLFVFQCFHQDVKICFQICFQRLPVLRTPESGIWLFHTLPHNPVGDCLECALIASCIQQGEYDDLEDELSQSCVYPNKTSATFFYM